MKLVCCVFICMTSLSRLAVDALPNNVRKNQKLGVVDIFYEPSSSSTLDGMNITNYDWEEVGQNIKGEEIGAWAGYSVGMNYDGSRIVVGSRYNAANADKPGHARVLELNNGVWIQLGNTIEGSSPGDRAGHSVAMSANGKMIIVGSPGHNGNGDLSGHARVFIEIDGEWEQVFDPIEGLSAGDQAGWSVSISRDGGRVVVGSPSNNDNGRNSGQARIFYNKFREGWKQVGRSIAGEDTGDNAGKSVGISSDGTRVIVGSPYNDGKNGIATSSGYARIFQEVDGDWEQVGSNIQGLGKNDEAGRSVGISGNGKRVVLGSSHRVWEGTSPGRARIFEDVYGEWMQVGGNIEGAPGNDRAGCRVAISDDGMVVGVAFPYFDFNDNKPGLAGIYQEVAGNWTRLGSSIGGVRAYDGYGSGVAVSADGMRVVTGSLQNDFNRAKAGHARVLEFSPLESQESQTSSVPSKFIFMPHVLSIVLVTAAFLFST